MSAPTPSRRDLLLASAGLLGLPAAVFGQSAGSGSPKHLLVIFAEGGWDVTYCLDPKLHCSGCTIEGPEVDEDPDDPDDREYVQTFGNLPIVLNDQKRPSVRPFFERWYGRTHVINGVWTGSIAHDPCRYRILTGTPDGRRPDLATITGYTHGGALPLGSIDMSGWGIAGPLAASSGRIGAQSQIAPLLGDERAFRRQTTNPAEQYPLFRPRSQSDAAVEDFLRQRVGGLRDRFGDGGHNDGALDDLVSSLDRAQRFRDQSSGIMDSLTVGDSTRFIEQLRMAVELIQTGMCHSVTVDTRNDWDTHEQNSSQHRFFDDLFSTLGGLMRELEARDMLDDVVVAVLSEMTRTPLRNAARGKDHWGHTSAMLLGAVRGNAVSGATDELLESQPIDLQTGEPQLGSREPPLKYDNLVAGILDLVGVESDPWLPGVTPFRGAHAG